jgi:dTDP-4-dehydrorhamnose reductase
MQGDAVELVVGADSMIGGALLQRLRAVGRRALGTSRRPHHDKSIVHLDLGKPPGVWDGPPVRTAYLCAAVSRLDACRRDPEGSAQVNVAGAVRLARLLAAQGAYVVFLSTNHVFDGTRPYRRPDEATCPFNEYGRQKAAAEVQVLSLGTSAAALRLTKVLGDRVALFDAWAVSLRRGECIRPYSDLSIAPVPLRTAVECLARLGRQRLPGVHHLSGDRDVLYADVARTVAELAGADEMLVEPVATLTAQPDADPPPRYTTLAVTRCGFTAPDVDATIRAAFEKPTDAASHAA